LFCLERLVMFPMKEYKASYNALKKPFYEVVHVL
jgi:hypothetical protein